MKCKDGIIEGFKKNKLAEGNRNDLICSVDMEAT